MYRQKKKEAEGMESKGREGVEGRTGEGNEEGYKEHCLGCRMRAEGARQAEIRGVQVP